MNQRCNHDLSYLTYTCRQLLIVTKKRRLFQLGEKPEKRSVCFHRLQNKVNEDLNVTHTQTQTKKDSKIGLCMKIFESGCMVVSEHHTFDQTFIWQVRRLVIQTARYCIAVLFLDKQHTTGDQCLTMD